MWISGFDCRFSFFCVELEEQYIYECNHTCNVHVFLWNCFLYLFSNYKQHFIIYTYIFQNAKLLTAQLTYPIKNYFLMILYHCYKKSNSNPRIATPKTARLHTFHRQFLIIHLRKKKTNPKSCQILTVFAHNNSLTECKNALAVFFHMNECWNEFAENLTSFFVCVCISFEQHRQHIISYSLPGFLVCMSYRSGCSSLYWIAMA